MGILGTLFGMPKVVGTVADTVLGGMTMLDEAFYTEQEKAENAVKVMDTWLKIQGAIADENSIRSITRRILAWFIMGTFLFLVVSACVIWRFNPEWAEYIKTMLIDSQVGYLAMIIGFFYFGSYGLKSVLKK